MKKNNKKTVVIIIVLILLFAVATGTSAKYVYNSVWSYYLTSKGLYFESDFLSQGTKKNAILNWDGSDIPFSLKNNNDVFVSEFDISYKVSCEVLGDEAEYLSCNLNDTGKNSFEGVLSSTAGCINTKDQNDVSKKTKAECEVGGYIWQYNSISKENVFNLTLLDATKQINEASVKIIVESTKPYKKVLTGIFNLNKIEEIETQFNVEYQQYSNYDELTLINKTSEEKCFLIGFDSTEYSIDTLKHELLDIYVDGNEKINGFDIKIGAEKSISYDFYRLKEEKNYTVDDFIVSEKEC